MYIVIEHLIILINRCFVLVKFNHLANAYLFDAYTFLEDWKPSFGGTPFSFIKYFALAVYLSFIDLFWNNTNNHQMRSGSRTSIAKLHTIVEFALIWIVCFKCNHPFHSDFDWNSFSSSAQFVTSVNQVRFIVSHRKNCIYLNQIKFIRSTQSKWVTKILKNIEMQC